MRLDGFEHATGAHCGSTALRDLSTHYDWGLSEPACFGLGSGLGFVSLELPTSPWRLFIGRPLWLESAFFDTLDVPHTERRGDDWATSWADLRGHLDRDDPVMVFVDLFHLDYYDTDTHFAPHSLLVVGYDEERLLIRRAGALGYAAAAYTALGVPIALLSLSAVAWLAWTAGFLLLLPAAYAVAPRRWPPG
jgi:hypothetical protein